MRTKPPGFPAAPIADRLAKYTTKTEACWEWTGLKNEDGYGKLHVRGKGKFAHRLAWAEVNGAIPSGQCVCHRCDNPGCVNPEHLFLGTQSENMKDKVSKGRHFIPPAFLANGPKGERNFNAKLTQQNVEVIRGVAGTLPTKEIAELYGISTASVSNVIARRTWRHI